LSTVGAAGFSRERPSVISRIPAADAPAMMNRRFLFLSAKSSRRMSTEGS
jgi:hypothetical protein